jgi:sulfur-carrier protein
MKVLVKLFARAREIAGCDELVVDLPEGAVVADLKEAVVRKVPSMHSLVSHSLWAVNAEYVPDNARISPDSEIALIPPVSGG